MFKASGVSATTYTPPNGGNKRALPPSRFSSHGNGDRIGPSPPPPRHVYGRAQGGGGSSSSFNGSVWSAPANGGSGVGGGGGAGAGAGGGAGYREDSFAFTRTGWKYSLEWVSVNVGGEGCDKIVMEKQQQVGREIALPAYKCTWGFDLPAAIT